MLPMVQEEFAEAYMRELAGRFAKCGYSPETLIAALWKAMAAMIKNDGSMSNEQAFWEVFTSIFGEDILKEASQFDSFYEQEFYNVRKVCGYDEKVGQLLNRLKEEGYRLVLASNPIFPLAAQKKRIEWVGGNAADFDYITSYENSSFCKPNPDYFRELLTKLNLTPDECLMVGNDATEDFAAEKAGLRLFFITKCLINREDRDISSYPQGDFDDLYEYINYLQNA